MVRVFIIEDHPLMRRVLREFLLDEPDLQVEGEAGSAEAALEQIARSVPDLALVDVQLPGMSGIDLVAQLAEQYPRLACVMLSGYGERNHVEKALAAGAQGYIIKGSPDELLAAIRQVMAGEHYISPALQG